MEKTELKQVSDAFKKALDEAMETSAFKDVVEATKAADDSGTFEVVISTADIDRSGESVSQDGWNLEMYKMNPIVLWGHDYYSLPIGVCDSIELVEGKLVAKGRFAPADANPFAQQVRRLYDAKIVRATSVGFIVSEMEGNNITKAELLEFSFVPVPANPYALSLRQISELQLDTTMLSMKGISIKTEEEVTETATETETTETAENATETTEENATEESTTETTETAEKTIYVEKKGAEELAQAVGAELATLQATLDTAISESSMKIIAMINGEEVAEEDPMEEDDAEKSKSNEGDAPEGVAPATEESQEEKEGEDVVKEFENFEDNRKILRALATATTNALESFNARAREHAKSVK